MFNSLTMTIPFERYKAVLDTHDFLMDLQDKAKTPRVPASVRNHALGVLRHYPLKHEMAQTARRCPDVFSTQFAGNAATEGDIDDNTL